MFDLGQPSPDFSTISGEEYFKIINSPAYSKDYYEQFIEPLFTALQWSSFSSPRLRLLSLACGYSHDFQFLDLKRILAVGIDLSPAVLRDAKDKFAESTFVAADCDWSPLKENSFDCAYATNAVVYKPTSMLAFLFSLLKPKAHCVVNFRCWMKNADFFSYYEQQGGIVTSESLDVKGCSLNRQIPMRVLNYTNCPDPICNLDRQVYFEDESAVRCLVETIGFRIDDSREFEYSSPASKNNKVDVLTLTKIC